jgi:membrane-associated phospholipid phosphatase
MPPIAVPGHASFPSGHSTEAHLMARLLARVMPAAVTQPRNPAAGSMNPSAASLLQRLAQRIARNREVLGLHYPSDTHAGVFLAARTEDLLVNCPTVQALLPGGTEDASLEWN